MSFDVTIHGRAEPRLLSRVVRIIAWQGAPLRELNYRALDAEDIRIHCTADCDDWRMTRLLMHFQKVPGVTSVSVHGSDSGLPPNPTALPSPAAL